MTKILLWNSLATRRRSASDTFLDNGLGVLKAHLEGAGHEVILEDWATDGFHAALSVHGLARPLRAAYGRLLAARRRGTPGPAVKALGAAAMVLQEAQTAIQRRRMEARLHALAWRVLEEGIPVVGMKLWYGEAFTWARRFGELLRETAPETLVVVGGYHATLYEEDVLRYGPFDLAVRGEGEHALAGILDVVGDRAGKPKKEVLAEIRRRDLENAIWRQGDQLVSAPMRPAQLAAKAKPMYGSTPGKVRIHVMIESLGCPWGKCHFCVHPKFHQRYIPRAVAEVLEEMTAMVAQGIGIFRFAGSDTPPAFGAKIAQGILDAGLTVVYGMGSRAIPNAADPTVFERIVGQYEFMLRSGLRSVFIGGETGHDRINRDVMNKGVTAQDLLGTARAIREAERRTGERLDLVLALIYPVPLLDGVTLEEVFRANLDLLEAFQPDSVMVTPPGPFKHSLWHGEKDRFGFRFGPDFLRSLMEYEYVLYKPPNMWPHLDLGLQGRDFQQILAECGRFRAAVERLGIPTDLSDEHFLMLRAAGYKGREGAEEFKRETLLDVVSCDYRRLMDMSGTINAESRRLAALGQVQASNGTSKPLSRAARP